jgi:hypothetical protein
MNVFFDVSYFQFQTAANIVISKVPGATKKLMEAAGKEILADSNRMVPKDTLTLMDSGFAEVSGNSALWVLSVGYADAAHDMQNPVSGKMASEYVVAVHEDLLAYHAVGEAKFLEKAFINWIAKYPRLMNQVLTDIGL